VIRTGLFFLIENRNFVTKIKQLETQTNKQNGNKPLTAFSFEYSRGGIKIFKALVLYKLVIRTVLFFLIENRNLCNRNKTTGNTNKQTKW
jgi:hypothetical protein